MPRGVYTRRQVRPTDRPTDRPTVWSEATGTKLGGEVTCNWCQLKTGYDPCEKCGKTLKRSWT